MTESGGRKDEERGMKARETAGEGKSERERGMEKGRQTEK